MVHSYLLNIFRKQQRILPLGPAFFFFSPTIKPSIKVLLSINLQMMGAPEMCHIISGQHDIYTTRTGRSVTLAFRERDARVLVTDLLLTGCVLGAD